MKRLPLRLGILLLVAVAGGLTLHVVGDDDRRVAFSSFYAVEPFGALQRFQRWLLSRS